MAASGTVTNLAVAAGNANILDLANPTASSTGFNVVSCKNGGGGDRRSVTRWDMTAAMSPDPGLVVVSNAVLDFTITTVPAEGLTGQTWWFQRFDLDGAGALTETWNSATAAGRIDGVSATKFTQGLTTGTPGYSITGKGGLVDAIIADAINNRSRILTTLIYIDPAAGFFNFTQGINADFLLSFDWAVVGGGGGSAAAGNSGINLGIGLSL